MTSTSPRAILGLALLAVTVGSLTVTAWADTRGHGHRGAAASLSGGHAHHDDHASAGVPEQVVGDYRVRVAYHSHGHGARPPVARAGGGRDHLMVFVIDAKTGDPVPYLPVAVTIHTDTGTPRTVKLSPMLGDRGFHYGADVAVPDTTTKVTVVIGPTTMKVMPSAAGRFAGTARATFEWPR